MREQTTRPVKAEIDRLTAKPGEVAGAVGVYFKRLDFKHLTRILLEAGAVVNSGIAYRSTQLTSSEKNTPAMQKGEDHGEKHSVR
jgi:hypothetical protein